MALETASFITQLVSTNPPGSDQVSQGDDHLRLIKAVLKSQFPNFTAAALNSTNVQIDSAVAKTVSGSSVLSLPADGVVGAPELVFASETTTGLYRAGAGNVRWSTLGADVFGFFASGVGVPAGKTLDLATSASQLTVASVALFPLTTANIGAGAVTTSNILDANVTYGKIQNVAASRLLGNPTGSPAATSEVSLGLGLAFSGATLASTYTPIAGTFKNLSIKVLTNTTIAVAADSVHVTDGSGNFLAVAPSVTIDMTVTGAAGRETGISLSNNTGYHVWVIAKPDGTTSALVNNSSTTISTFPSGYTMKARIGWVHTGPATTNLMGTWQLGRRAQYVVGLAQTTALPQLVTGSVGNPVTPTYVSQSLANVLPATASVFRGTLMVPSTTSAVCMVAPNGSYGSNTTTTNPAPISMNFSTGGNVEGAYPFEFLLESTAVFYTSSTAGIALFVVGWEDNI